MELMGNYEYKTNTETWNELICSADDLISHMHRLRFVSERQVTPKIRMANAVEILKEYLMRDPGVTRTKNSLMLVEVLGVIEKLTMDRRIE